MKRLLAALSLTLALARFGAGAEPAPLPGDSLYQLQVELSTQDGRAIRLDSLRGQPVLISMFYASCDGVCPAIAFQMRRLDAALTPAQRQSLRLVLVSFDPRRDDQAALERFARLNQLEGPRWIVARAPDPGVRELAAALDERYRELPGGAFSHSTIIAVLDGDGVIRARSFALAAIDPEFMRVLRATTKEPLAASASAGSGPPAAPGTATSGN
jgi:protein SCO1/2